MSHCVTTLSERADLYASYESEQVITWCGGCGNYGIQNALRRALVLENLSQQDVLLCFDVGCSGNGSDKMHMNSIHGLHGRVLPLAAGAKLANHHKTVIASAGDGATFSEGANHVVHAVRSDYPITFLHHNNANYALTTGQPSSLTPCGQVMSAAPDGTYTPPLNALQFVLSLNPSFVARTLSADIDHMTEIFRAAIQHPGLAFVDILQTCPTYNKKASNHWYLTHTEDVDGNHDPTDIWAARKLADRTAEEGLPLGILYHQPRANYYEQMPMRKGRTSALVDEVRPYDVGGYLDALR